MIDFTPQPIAFSLGPLEIHWYGIAYAVGLAVTYWVVSSEVRRRGLSQAILANGFIIVAVAALIGGRLYHVIDQWALYKDDPLKIVLPPYSGLGVYGGIVTGFLAGIAYARYKKQSIWTWSDCAAPGILIMQGIARWGNFANQELYGPPTNLPWGIAIQCANRTPTYACPPGSDPAATLGQHFQPLFLYESISGIRGLHRPALDRAPRASPATWRHRPPVLRVVRDDPVPPRAVPLEQLALLRHPDGLDHLGRVRARRDRDAGLAPSAGGAATARRGGGRRR